MDLRFVGVEPTFLGSGFSNDPRGIAIDSREVFVVEYDPLVGAVAALDQTIAQSAQGADGDHPAASQARRARARR